MNVQDYDDTLSLSIAVKVLPYDFSLYKTFMI